ncbi:hypothetical protein V5O48_017332 [Marasmius crinis-equi]|uniref:Uncharacterized protein n=1 Tax=Marasmius crinis-equi TaxID=585013 RepID=A0ABR3EP93_9AGAR
MRGLHETLSRKRSTLSNEAREEQRQKARESSRRYYNRNRTQILDKRESNRLRQYDEEHGGTRNYAFRDVRPRDLLNIKDNSPERYPEELGKWQEEKLQRLRAFKTAQAELRMMGR